MTDNQLYVDMYHNGWSLSDLAKYAGMSKTSMHTVVSGGVPTGDDTPLSIKALKGRGLKTVKVFTTLNSRDTALLQALQKTARRVGRRTPHNARERYDSSDLSKYIQYHVNVRMVPVSEVARLLGVTHRAVRARCVSDV